MKLRDFFFAKGKISRAAESVEAPEPVTKPSQEEVALDLSLLLGFQERIVREDVASHENTVLRGETRAIPFSEYIKQLVEESLKKRELGFEVKISVNHIYLETSENRMIFMSRAVLKALFEQEAETANDRQYNLFNKPLELVYSGSRNYLIVVKSIHDWGIRMDTSDGPRSFRWDKIEGANYSLLLDKLPFDNTYKLKPTAKGFAMRWALEAY